MQRPSSQSGFTLVEMLVAMVVLSFGIVGTIAVFTSSKNASLVAQRHEVAVHQAQRAIEDLRSLGYESLALTGQPGVADRLETDSTKLGYYSGAGTMVVKGGSPATSEQFAVDATNGDVDPTPQSFNVGGSGISGKVYQYVTWRPESCGTDGTGQALCPGSQQTKRITVAVTIDSKGRPGLAKPVWINSVVTDPTSEPYE